MNIYIFFSDKRLSRIFHYKHYFILLNVFLINIIWAQSAGMLATSGKSLIFIEGNNQNEDMELASMSGTTLGGGYIFNNSVEFSLFYMMQEIESDISPNYNLDGFLVGLYYHDKLWKEKNNFPINFRFGMYFSEAEAQARWLTNLGMEISAQITGFSGGIYSNSYPLSIISLIGFLDLHSMKGESFISYGVNSYSEKTNMTSTTIGLIINYGNFYITPMIGRLDEHDVLEISYGMLFPQ